MKTINAEEFSQGLKNAVVIDVRTPEEYDKDHIENSILVPIDTFKQYIEKIVPGKSTKVYLYCLGGNRSSRAAKIMEGLGYKNVFDLQNGILSLQAKNFPVKV